MIDSQQQSSIVKITNYNLQQIIFLHIPYVKPVDVATFDSGQHFFKWVRARAGRLSFDLCMYSLRVTAVRRKVGGTMRRYY